MAACWKGCAILLAAFLCGGLCSCNKPPQVPEGKKKAKPSAKVFPALPDPEPFAQGSGSARQDPLFKVASFPAEGAKGKAAMIEQPSFTVGNKAVYVRKAAGRDMADKENIVSVYIDGKEAGCFMFWGSYEGNSGFPFQAIAGDPGQLVADKEMVTFRKPYLTPAGSRAEFQYTLRSLGDSKVELAWDLGVTPEEKKLSPKPFGVALWFTMDGASRGREIRFGDKKLKPASRESLLKEKVATEVAGDFVLAPEQPLAGYSVQLGGKKGQVTESLAFDQLGNDRLGWILRCQASPEETKGLVVIDLGEGALPQKDVPLPVAGYDFWKIDGIQVPASPVRNLMPNPSFEQGLRYWRWCGGGASYTPDAGLKHEVVPGGYIGKNALRLNQPQSGAAGLESFPLPLEDGKTYTLSFYAKADKDSQVTVGLGSAAKGGKFKGKYGTVFGDNGSPESIFKITPEWKRYSRTFTADGAGVRVLIGGPGGVMVDGLQLEEGTQPTEFVEPPIQGWFTSSNPDNDLTKGAEIGSGFRFSGKPGTEGKVRVRVKNAFSEVLSDQTLSVKIPEEGVLSVPLPLDKEKLGEGVFVVRADFEVKGTPGYTDYYRFSIMDPLSNTHATKDIFGGLLGGISLIERGDDLGKKFMEWGFGSTSWGINTSPHDMGVRAPMEKKYRIANNFNTTIPVGTEAGNKLQEYRNAKEVTPEMEKLIEESAYERVRKYDPKQYNTWHFGNEEESSYLPGHGLFDEYFKVQSAAARGAKRANPAAVFAPTNGTSGYSRLRGYEAVEGYLKAAKDHGFKYDAIAVHPYGSIDKGTLSQNDLDEETARLIEQMARYGYGEETPIYYTEMFNVPETLFPPWGAGPAYDDYMVGKLTYDFGNREFIQAASVARLWIISLKYWPRLRSTNVWVGRPFLDYYLSPTILAKVANTLGHFFPDVAWQADIKPAAGIRGYGFKLKDGTGIAAIWCVNHDVENGLRRGPDIRVKFGQSVEIFDLMGNRRQAPVGTDGYTTLRLTPPPLLIRARDVAALSKSLQNAESDDSKSSLAVSMEPSTDGTISAKVVNLTGRPQSGVLEVAGAKLDYALKPEGKLALPIPGQTTMPEFGKLFRWDHDFAVRPSKGQGVEDHWNMDYFYVPKTKGMPEWDKIPAIEITNRYVSKSYKGALPAGDQKAWFRTAWDEENFYLRVEVEDDHFIVSPELWQQPGSEQALWVHDGCLEVYFDTGANGRTNSEKTYDNDDYRYDFSIGKSGQSGPGQVNRYREVYHQLADGINMPSKKEAAEKIKCDFQRTEKGYTYTITFGKRYLEPIVLRKGFISGFALYLHDKDETQEVGCPKGLSLATAPGSVCDFKPHFWPLMILAGEKLE